MALIKFINKIYFFVWFLRYLSQNIELVQSESDLFSFSKTKFELYFRVKLVSS